MTQFSLFQVEIAREVPSTLKTADLAVIAVGRDGFEYAAKRQSEHALLPASEWFCYHLGYKLQLALPPFAVLTDGAQQHFGSRFEGGVQQWSDVSPLEQLALLQACASEMSRILALDLLVGNADRHLNNFLFREQRVGGARTVIAMDFSRGAMVRGWPLDPVPMDPGEATMRTIALLRGLSMWDATSAQLVLASAQAVPASDVRHWLASMPPAWLDASAIDTIFRWWSSTLLGDRIAACTALL